MTATIHRKPAVAGEWNGPTQKCYVSQQQRQAWAREAHALEDQVRALVQACPNAVAAMRAADTSGSLRKYDCDLLPVGVAALANPNPATSLLEQCSRLRWLLVGQLRGVLNQKVRRWAPRLRMPYEDAYQTGLIGAYRGAMRWDPDQGVSFACYCWPWIRATLDRANKDDATPLEASEIEECIQARRQEEHGATAAFLTHKVMCRRFLASWVDITRASRLTPREREVVEMRFGLRDGKERTYREIASEIGLVPEAARLSLNKGLGKLRDRVTVHGTHTNPSSSVWR